MLCLSTLELFRGYKPWQLTLINLVVNWQLFSSIFPNKDNSTQHNKKLVSHNTQSNKQIPFHKKSIAFLTNAFVIQTKLSMDHDQHRWQFVIIVFQILSNYGLATDDAIVKSLSISGTTDREDVRELTFHIHSNIKVEMVWQYVRGPRYDRPPVQTLSPSPQMLISVWE